MRHLNVRSFRLQVAVALGILLLIAFWIVSPKMAERSRLRADLAVQARLLEGARPATPSSAELERWSRYQASLRDARSQLSTYYGDRSRSFRRWFPGLTETPSGAPPRDAFVASYQDEARKLERALNDRVPSVAVGGDADQPAPGFHWEELRIEHWDAVGRENENQVLRQLQKRFRARRLVADLALSGGVRIGRILDFHFAERLHEKFPERKALPGEIVPSAWPGLSGTPEPFTFGFAVELPYSDAGAAIRGVLLPGNDALLVRVLGSQMTIREQNPRSVSFTYETDAERDRKTLEIRKGVTPRPVVLLVTCRILDVDP